jgi:uncharacterized protein with HEPN domain
VESYKRAEEYTKRLSGLDAFQQSRRDRDAVIRNIEIIGEAARQIHQHAPDVVVVHPELPWIEMRGMRNKMILSDFDVDVSVVRGIVTNDLPRLKEQIDDLRGKPPNGV